MKLFVSSIFWQPTSVNPILVLPSAKVCLCTIHTKYVYIAAFSLLGPLLLFCFEWPHAKQKQRPAKSPLPRIVYEFIVNTRVPFVGINLGLRMNLAGANEVEAIDRRVSMSICSTEKDC